jgi:hypothetical protein
MNPFFLRSPRLRLREKARISGAKKQTQSNPILGQFQGPGLFGPAAHLPKSHLFSFSFIIFHFFACVFVLADANVIERWNTDMNQANPMAGEAGREEVK